MGLHPRLPGLISDREPDDDSGPSRRGFLARLAAGGAVLTVGSQLLPIGQLAGLSGAQEGEGAPTREGDQAIVAFLASVGLAGAAAYRAATTLETVSLSEPVVEVMRTFGFQHGQQAAALSSVLLVPVEEPNATLVAEQTAVLEAATDQAAILAAFIALEEAVTATHLEALGELERQATRALVSRALPVCAQHAVVLGSLDDQDLATLIPETQTTEGALTVEGYPLGAAAEPDAEADAETTTTTEAGAEG